MKVLHIIGGGDVGGAKMHVLSLVKKLSSSIDIKLISLREGSFADDALAMGIDVEIIRSGNIIKDIKKIIEIIRNENYQILHSHGAKANMFSAFCKTALDIPTVTTVHSDYRLDYLQNFLKMLSFGIINTIALRFIDFYIGVSDNFKNMLTRRKFNPQNIFTVYNGIDFESSITSCSKSEFAKKYKINIENADFIVGILARLHPVKGVTTFLQAAKEVIKAYPNIKFLIGGEGEEKKSLMNKAARLGISNNVIFCGWIDNAYEFLNVIDINVLTSLSESFPYSILEGARLKKATISTDVGGISDLILNYENGFLFAPKDYKKLASLIIKLIEDDDLRTKVGQKIFDRASSLFSLENMYQKQLFIYKTILEKNVPISNRKLPYDVIISGYYGFKNIGDDAMLAAIINNLKLYKHNIRIMILSRNPYETSKTYGVETINRVNLFKILQIMRKTKLFINGGGSLIQDNTSTRSLLYYLGMIWLAKKIGIKVMVYANGIGPLTRKYNRKLTKFILNQVDVITVRDEMSENELRRLSINAPKIFLTADPALNIEGQSDIRIQEIFRKEEIKLERPLIGFSIRSWGKSSEYESIIAELADFIWDAHHAAPLFIPMHYPEDLAITKKIISKMKHPAFCIKNNYSVEDVMGIVEKCEILIGMRLHALIFATSVNVPVIGLVYDQKVEAFLRYVNQASAGPLTQLQYKNLKELTNRVLNNKESIKTDLQNNISILKNKALQNAVIAIDLLDSCNKSNFHKDSSKNKFSANKVDILDIPIDKLSFEDSLKKIKGFLSEDKLHVVFTPNPEIIIAAGKDKELKNSLYSADMLVPDGIGVVLASKILKSGIRERVAGFDLICGIFSLHFRKNLKVFLFGAKPHIIEAAAKNISEKYPRIKVVGYMDGYFDKWDEDAIIDTINSANPDLLLVGLGAPKQEKWIYTHKDKLNAKVAIGVGGAFDILSGKKKRAPMFFQKCGMEWLYRLFQEPKRFFRMFKLPLFMLKVMQRKLRA